METRRLQKYSRWILATTAVLALVALSSGYARTRAPSYQIHRWRRDAETMPVRHVEQRVGRLADLGDDGLLVLVEYLEHPRDEVGRAARQTLRDHVARWKLLESADSSKKIAKLMRALTHHDDDFRREGKTLVTRLAQEALLWPFDQAAVDVEPIIADCERLLQRYSEISTVDAMAKKAEQNDEGRPRSAPSGALLDLPPELLGPQKLPAHRLRSALGEADER